MKYCFFTILCFALLAGCKKDDPATIPSVTTTAITSITDHSATGGGQITDDGGAPVAIKGICWSTSPAPTIADSTSTEGSGIGNFSSSMTGLKANTTYYVRAYAMNSAGTAYGNEQVFTTSPGLATLTTTAVTEIIPLSAKSGGNIFNDGGSPVTARGVCWSTSPHPTITGFKTTDGDGDGSFISELTPLASQTIYYVRAYATNGSGTTYGNEISFTSSSANTVTDIDGNVYPTVQVGSQTWMTTNLKTTHYQNGDPITNGLTNFNWVTETTGAYTFPNGDESNNTTLGKYYSVYAIVDDRNVCPSGWHVPSDEEWKTLEITLGMTPEDADRMNNRGTIGPLLQEGGSSGLNLNLSGYYFPSSDTYSKFDEWGLYWSSTRRSATNLNLGLYFRGVYGSADPLHPAVLRTFGKYAMSVRCVKD